MSTRPFLSTLASALVLLILAGTSRAQLVPEAEMESPLLAVVMLEGGSLEVQLVAGPQHAGDVAFIVLSASQDPEIALAVGEVLEVRTLDAEGSYRGPLVPSDLSQAVDPAQLLGVVMDRSARLRAATTVRVRPDGGSIPLVTQPGLVVCMLPAPPACTGGLLPDLVITNITINVAQTSTACTGSPLPRTSCGAVGFTVTATVKNQGTCALRCKTNVAIKWGTDFSTPGLIQFEPFNQIVTTPDVLPGGTFTVTRPYYLGPCVGAPPRVLQFSAIVDPNNAIAELSEVNNTATPVNSCHFQ